MNLIYSIVVLSSQFYLLNAIETTTVGSNSTTVEKSKPCPKTCKTSLEKIALRKCSVIGYKEKEFADSQEICSSICEREKVWCSDAIYVPPRKVNPLDLHSLFKAVISKSSWVRASELDKIPTKKTQEEDEYRNLGENDESVLTKNVHLSRKKRNDKKNEKIDNTTMPLTTNGTCYLFESSSVKKLKCQKFQTSFRYYQVSCKADEICLRSARNCPCGWCGSECKNLNYRRVPNSCMGQHFFGHKAVTSVKECINFCLETPGCKSVDYGNIETCLINKVNRTDKPLQFGCDGKNDEKFDYYEIVCDSECANEKPRPPISEDVCMNNPKICKHGGICETIELPHPHQAFTYQCNCPCNYCGKHCEKPNMRTLKNACMKYPVLVWSIASTAKECIAMCQQNIYCLSVSFSGFGTCVLHWAMADNESIIPSAHCPKYQSANSEPEWTYFGLICDRESCSDKVQVLESKVNEGCRSSPCANNGDCADVFHEGKNIGYHCTCRCGYCGDNCEQLNYDFIKNACIWGNHISNLAEEYYRESVTLKQCLSICAQNPTCKGIDYSGKGSCYMNKKTSRQVKSTPSCNNYARDTWNLYELSCNCQNQRVIYP